MKNEKLKQELAQLKQLLNDEYENEEEAKPKKKVIRKMFKDDACDQLDKLILG